MMKQALRIGLTVVALLATWRVLDDLRAGATLVASGFSRTSDVRLKPDTPSRVAAARQVPAWQSVTRAKIDRWFDLQRLPPDSGIVAPIAAPTERPDSLLQPEIAHLRKMLPAWAPGKVADPVQRVRNLLYVAAVPDVLKVDPLERFVPLVVFERLQQEIPKDDLIKILYWIARRPYQGDDSAAYALQSLLGIADASHDMDTTRERVALYAAKLIGRLTGKLGGSGARGLGGSGA